MLDVESTDAALTQSSNFASLDELDPSLAEDFKLYCEREAPLEVRTKTGSNVTEAGSVEAIRFRVLVRGVSPELEAVRVELTSESDLFFHFTHTIGEEAFRQHMQQEQRLMVDYDQYPSMFVRLLNSCIQSPQAHIAVLLIEQSGHARLDFIQNMGYKFVELMSCQFQASDEGRVKQQLTFRYNAVKSHLALMQARLTDINALVKLKNPSLLLQLQSVAPRMPGISSSLLNISDGLSSPNKTLLTSFRHSPSSTSSPSKNLLTSLKHSPSSLISPQKTLSMSLLRSPSEVRGTLQQSDRGLSQKGLPWAY